MNISIIYSNKRGEEIPAEAISWKGDFIFSYRNYWLLPDSMLKSADVMAINFHPATPNFPGSGSYSWALYENTKIFGITIHLMNYKFDNGKILDVFTFPIDKRDNIKTLIKKTSKFSVSVFQKFIGKLSKKTINQMHEMTIECSKHKWAREARTLKDIDMMSKLDLQMPREEISRRIRAFHFDKFPVYIEHKGFRFKYDSKI